MPVNNDKRLPSSDAVQLDREHRLYQADWLLRFYRFDVQELIDQDHPYLDLKVDPKANWALNNLDSFPVEINRAPYEMLLRIPGVGVRGAQLITRARRESTLRLSDLAKLGIAVKRARYFITCNGEYAGKGIPFTRESIRSQITAPIDGGSHGRRADKAPANQLSLFDSSSYHFSEKPPLAKSSTAIDNDTSSIPALREWHRLTGETIKHG
jgi:predicted DNA-binding helix-hairpin-helix protein